MKSISIPELQKYVEQNIGEFHKSRLDNLQNLKLSEILKRKNPYLFKAKNILLAQDLVKTLLDAHLSSQEETIFGNFLEKLAIFINDKVYAGIKAPAHGIDLDFKNKGKRYLVSIKSGPNWGNSSQIRKMAEDFKAAKKVLRTSKSNIEIVAVNGCCYGRDNNPDKGDYFKYCGQNFWAFISGDDRLYLDLILPLGHKAKEKNEEFNEEYSKIINTFSADFNKEFCAGGRIDWEKLVKYNSAAK